MITRAYSHPQIQMPKFFSLLFSRVKGILYSEPTMGEMISAWFAGSWAYTLIFIPESDVNSPAYDLVIEVFGKPKASFMMLFLCAGYVWARARESVQARLFMVMLGGFVWAGLAAIMIYTETGFPNGLFHSGIALANAWAAWQICRYARLKR